MGPGIKERRDEKRSYVEPYDSGTFLEFTLDGKRCRSNLLDTSPGGVGMLVRKEQEDILKQLVIGDRKKMKYTTPEASLYMDFELRHITLIQRGSFEGHFQVGLAFPADRPAKEPQSRRVKK